MRRSWLSLAVGAATAIVVGLAVPASAQPTIFVDEDHAQCPQATFTSIQAAVTAAPPGATIMVCPGVYQEQVKIPVGKDGLELASQVPLQAVIKAPPVMLDRKAIVHVDGAQDIVLRHFTITGPGGGPCDSIRFGVLVDNEGSALIRHNHITQIHDTPFSGCQNGTAVQIGSFPMGASSPGRAVIRQNLIDEYQKAGVVANEPGTVVEIWQNEIVGVGPTPIIAQNGIQLGFDATGEVRQNDVSLNDYAAPVGDFFEGSGILLFEVADAIVRYNDVYRNGDGILVDAAGIERADVAQTQIIHNKVYENTADGIWLNAAFDNDVSFNLVWDNVRDGIHFEADTADNAIEHNQATGDGRFDCFDDSVGPGTAGTANFWIKNLGNTENRPGLCKPKGGDA